MATKQINMSDLKTIIIDLYKKSMKEVVEPELKDAFALVFDNVHPQEWAEDFPLPTINNVSFDEGSSTVVYDVVFNGVTYYEQIRLSVIDKGNNQSGGPLTTAPNTHVLNDNIDGNIVHGDVVWVKNKNYPNATKERTYTIKKNGKTEQRTYRVKMSKYWPIYEETELPSEFNREGYEVLKNAILLMSKLDIAGKCDDYVKHHLDADYGLKI